MKLRRKKKTSGDSQRLPDGLIAHLPVLASLPYVAGEVTAKLVDESYVVFLSIRVDLPAKGALVDIRKCEPVAVLIPPDFPSSPPRVVPMRDDFPAVPHFTRRPGERHGTLCLTRQAMRDWWHGKTIEDAVLAAYRWLVDAAAGELVKRDDPFEPLIVDGRNPVVEVDFMTARTEAQKHNGVWDTIAREIPIPGLHAVRLVVGSGDVPTRIWFQDNLQERPWIDVPTDVQGVLSLASGVGFEAERVRYWIEKGGARHSRVLTVFGVRRPKQVMGHVDAEEWVAFDFHRKAPKEDWVITSHLVLSRFERDLARKVSGLDAVVTPRKVVVIGAGALGSAVCEMLARSGTVHLSIVDKEVLRPHNLARHILRDAEVGQAKASAVADHINSIFPVDEVAVAHISDILDVPEQELCEILKDARCVIDCSASVAVQHRLAMLTARSAPTVTAFQINAGEGTVLMAEDAVCNGRTNAIEAALMTRERETPVVAAWLTERTEPLALGGGCSSGSARIADSRVKLGAAWVCETVLSWLSTGTWPGTPIYGIQTNATGQLPTTSCKWTTVEMESVVETDGGWRACVLTSVVNDLNRFARNADRTETGGILIGRANRQAKTFYVCEAWSAPPDSEESAVGFTRGRRKLANKLALLEADTGDNLTYVGEWHAHPPRFGARLSARDSATAKEMAKKLSRDRIPALCVITDRAHHDVHVVQSSAAT